MSYDSWKTTEPEDRGDGHSPLTGSSPEATFRKMWRYVKAKGNVAAMEDFLAFHGQFPMLFGSLVEEAKEELEHDDSTRMVGTK